MPKIILAREEDKGELSSPILVRFVMCLVGGFAGIPVGTLLSAVMQVVLKDSSAPVMYGFYAGPIILGMLIAFLYIRKDTVVKNHTICTKCKHKMEPATPEDTIFHIPAEHGDTYENPLEYLAKNMVRVSSIREIPPYKRGCYVCCYVCSNCANRIVRIADFLPQRGTCHWAETYYYDFGEFVQARQKNDLL